MRNVTLTFFLGLFCSTAFAQLPLPYSTSFETQSEQDDWEQFRTGVTDFYDWGFATPSTGAYMTHDYPVGASASDTTIDWFVSPEIHFHSTSKLQLSANLFNMIGVTPEDRFEIWVSMGSKDPADGDYQMLVDMTNYGVNGQWTDTSGIVIADTGVGYMAFVYQATQNWFTVAVDSIEITPDQPLALSPVQTQAAVQWNFDPHGNTLNVSDAQKNDRILFYDALGARIGEASLNQQASRIAAPNQARGLLIVACYRQGELIKSTKFMVH